MATTGQRLVAALGLGAGLGYGGYFLVQQSEVQRLAKDQKDLESIIDSERKRLSSSAKLLETQEKNIAELQRADADRQKAIKDVESKLDAARKQVAQLEGQLKAKQDDSRRIAADLVQAHSKVADVRAEAERAKQSVSLAERSLVLAKQKVAEAKQLTNPLNHPKVKALLGKK